MRKEKFFYNPQTLKYEKVVTSLSTTLLKVFAISSGVIIMAFLLFIVSNRYFPSLAERELISENKQMVAQIKYYESEFDNMSKIMDDVKERHNYAHREIYGMNPIDQSVWEGGIGGHDKYKDLKQLKHSGKLLAEVNEKIDKLKQKMDTYNSSLSDVISKAKEKEKMFAHIPSIKPVRSDKLARNVNLLSGFGMRLHPIHHVMKMHKGIDFTAPRGTAIQATGDGVVIAAGRGQGYGNRVKIDHGYGYISHYAHMSRIDVKVGQKVKRGEQIGLVGSTGASTGPHCHYEIIKNGTHINPIQFVSDGLTPKEYQQLVNAAQADGQSMD